MDQLISKQKELAESLERFLKNFNKDGPSRKTADYLIQKRETLTSLWLNFKTNHAELLTLLKDDHPYIAENLFEKTQSIFENAKQAIENCEQKLATRPATPTNVASTSAFPTLSIQPSIPLTTATIPTFTYTAPITSTHSINYGSTQTAFPIQYLDTSRLNNLPKLPPIKIPKFSGNYKEWKSFIDIFTNVIHNNHHLSNVEKMQYLLFHLEGDAKKVISHLQLNNDNYNTALRLIKERFNNNRKIITTYINTIMDAKRVEYRSQEDIIMLFDVIRECLEALKTLNCKTDEWGPLIVCIAIRKLDPESLRLFEESLFNSKEMPSTADLLNFLERRHQVLDSIKNSKQTKTEAPYNNKKKSFHTAIKRSCVFCNKDHSIYHCIEFKKLNVEDRIAYVSQKKLCLNCLAHNKEEKCRTSKSCFYCKKKHHTLLHKLNEANDKQFIHKKHASASTKENTNNPVESDATKHDAVTLYNKSKMPSVLLPTAMVRVKNIFGHTELLRALVDPGSQVSLITEEAVQNLKLPKERIRSTILGVGDTDSTKSNSKVSLTLQLQYHKGACLRVEALVLPKLSSRLPDSYLSGIDTSRFNNITLADPNFNQPGPIDLLLGADVYANIILDGHKPGKPTAQNTKLGWILFGNVPSNHQESYRVSTFISLVEMDQKLQQFWEMESETDTTYKTTDTCEEHFKKTYKRDQTGRYIVRLPFKENAAELGNSRNAAIARLIQIEKKLAKNSSDMIEYNRFLNEYLTLGHMSPASAYKGDEGKVCYLPHHAVFKRESTTTKLRVVFDASCRTETQVSLNDILHNGPKLQQDLHQILLRWRKHRYVFTADIEKMFRQIKVSHKDRNFQRILWRQDPSQPIQEFTLNTVTYGTAPATYLAVRALKQLADDEGNYFPFAKKVLNNDFYIDDMLSGGDTKAEARELQIQITSLLKRGGFNLRKWTSNSEELLRDMPENMLEKGALEIASDDTIKTLGIHWSPFQDEFHFKINFQHKEPTLTKRVLAAKIASIFDPLGFLAPITITAKLIMQALWKMNVDWDQTPPAEIANSWQKLEKEMQEIELIKIPRWFNHHTNQEIQLHGFCDASEKAYAAAIYARTIDSFGKVHTTLLTAKTKVTPLKQKISLPKLELCGALLLARLLKTTIQALEINITKIFAWSDSEIALSWIANNPNDLDTYQGNRVSEIQRLFNINIWRHVSSAENPADVASRGIRPSRLRTHNLWWRGPLWLTQPTEAWPIQKYNIQINQSKSQNVKVFKTTMPTQNLLTCSTYTRQVRVIAYCLRFINNCRIQKTSRNLNFLTSEEIQESKNRIIKLVQAEHFSEEVNKIKKGITVKNTSKIRKLHPYLDAEGILRVGGRIQNSNLAMEAKHQILLPQKHHITDLVIDHAHQQTLHGGIHQTLNYVRNIFWIVDGKREVQRRNNKCIKCLRHRQKVTEPLMGSLPTARVTPSPPFSHCGIDYAGPFLTKRSKGRGTTSLKGYISVFVCMVTKAVHLELVSDLSSDAFLAAYKRFVARRGIPKQVLSDNGTNFVGAKNKMHQDLLLSIKASTKQAAEITANDGTEWKFIPAASPHFGGLWEAAVKSVKHHLKRILGETLLTYEEFTTVLYQVEACLNSRPIGQHSSDPKDLEPLTPGHFLIGRPLIAPPEPDIADEKVYQRWKFLTKLYQNIWKRWSNEYLSLLQQRSKWTTEGKNPSIGELVLVKEDNLPPQKWSLGRIIELHPGEDGVVRIASVQYKNGIKKRPLVKLCQLPLSIYDTQEQNSQTAAYTNMTAIKKFTKKSRPKSKQILSEPELWSRPEHFHQISKGKRKEASATTTPPKRKKTKIAPCTWASKLLFTTLSILYYLTLAFAQEYEIFTPKSGFYVESLGTTQIKRGDLRLQVTFPLDEILKDKENIDSTWKQIKDMCERTKKLTDITHCQVLFQHLSTRRNILLRNIEEIVQLTETRNRSKRGVLGNILTSIFGINDEIYTDIEMLQHNQQDLLHSSNQQMLLLNTKINQSNFAIMEKLKHFDARLAQVVASVNDMNTWFMAADHNKIGIEVVSTYISAEDYYDEVHEKYNNLLNAIHKHGHILNFVSLQDIYSVIRNISRILDTDLVILTFPQNRLEVEAKNNTIKVYGYLNIVERSTYELIHVTPIPYITKSNIFLIADAKFSTFAVNFDQQTYFTLQSEELKACSVIEKHLYLCGPRIIHDIEDSPSCVIDEIYNRHPKINCELQHLKITGSVWKALMMKNTWLYITNETTVASIFCKGRREELLLNNTGIIHLQENCYIKTKEIILKTALEHTADVITSHMKEVIPEPATFHSTKPPLLLRPGLLLQPNEQLLEYSQEPELYPIILRKAIISHSISAASTCIFIILAILLFKCCKNPEMARKACCRKPNTTDQTHRRSSTEVSIQDHFNRVLQAAGPQHVHP